jgi:hypothetical protein
MEKGFSKEKIASFLDSIQVDRTSVEKIEDKLKSIEYFLNWASTKGYITKDDFNQLSAKIANIKASIASQKRLKSEKTFERIIIEPKNLLISVTHLKSVLYSRPVLALIILVLATIVLLSTVPEQRKQYSAITSTPTFNKGKILSFKGKLTDNSGTPITNKTDVNFRLYTQANGGQPIYTGSCVGVNGVVPDIHGDIQVKLGKDCGMSTLNDSLFTSNNQLYLGITVGKDPEMLPRKQIANVGFATNASSLQGLPAGNSTSSIPYINEDGDLLIEAENAGIKATSKSANFTVSSANNMSVEAGSGDLVLETTEAGKVIFKTHSQTEDKERLVIDENGHIAINGADTALFNMQVAGDIGPDFSGVYSLGSFSNQWGNIYGKTIYQNGNQVCDTSNNCANSSSWSALTNPDTDLSLNMATNTTKFTYGGSTALKNLFTVSDTAYNSGTGYLMNIASAPGSQIHPFRISAGGANAFVVTHDNLIGIGTDSPLSRLHVLEDGVKNKATYGGYFENKSENNSTDGINKYGLYVSSTGGFAGSSGTKTNNYGLYINTTTGADTNYDIYAASGAYLSTGGTWTNASSRDLKENFTSVDTSDILAKINQLDLSSWNYKTENASIRHLGPIAEDFYNIFQLGNSNKSISTIDPAGVALAGIQALDKKITNVQESLSIVTITSSGDAEVINTSNNEPYVYTGDLDQVANNTYSVRLSSGKIIDTITTFGEIIVGKVKTGLVDAEKVVVRNGVFAKKVNTNQLEANSASIDTLNTKSINASDKVTSPVIETSSLEATQEAKSPLVRTNQIEGLSDNVTINLNKDSTVNEPQNRGPLAELIIKGLGNKAVTTIDAEGNINTAGTISAQSASISGQLSANVATISGELYADNIKSKTIDELHNQLNSNVTSLSDLSNQMNSVQSLLANIKNQQLPDAATYSSLSQNEASAAAQFVTLNTLNTNTEDLTVTHLANLYRVSVSESLSIGNTIINDGSISALSDTLTFASLGSINFFDSTVRITKDGSITTQGVLTARGGVKTSSIEITNDSNTSVAKINPDGTAEFQGISLNKYLDASSSAIIAAPVNLAQNGTYSPALETTTETAGVGILPINNSSVIVYNDTIKESSLVYLTSTGTVPAANLTVVKKVTCQANEVKCRPYFQVAVDKPVTNEITFNWLIIQ